MKNSSLLTFIILLSGMYFSSFAGKKIVHFISIPFVEGTGIYTSATALKNADNVNTKVASVTNLALLGTQVTMGMFMVAGVDEKKPNIRTAHKILAYTLNIAGIWLSISTSLDDGTKGTATQYTSYGYNVSLIFPVLLFTF